MQILFLIIEGFVSEYKGSERQITKTNLSLPADCDIDDSSTAVILNVNLSATSFVRM